MPKSQVSHYQERVYGIFLYKIYERKQSWLDGKSK